MQVFLDILRGTLGFCIIIAAFIAIRSLAYYDARMRQTTVFLADILMLVTLFGIGFFLYGLWWSK